MSNESNILNPPQVVAEMINTGLIEKPEWFCHIGKAGDWYQYGITAEWLCTQAEWDAQQPKSEEKEFHEQVKEEVGQLGIRAHGMGEFATLNEEQRKPFLEAWNNEMGV